MDQNKWWDILKVILVIGVLAWFGFNALQPQTTDKPVIYLYPEQEVEVEVQIAYRGDLTVLYPSGVVQKDVMIYGTEIAWKGDMSNFVASNKAGDKAADKRDVVSWKVTARPDGTLIDHADGREYSYLFWEGEPDSVQFDFSQGYCVAGEDTAAFLQEILPQIGLTPREYNEFIVYWLPLMQDNPYNIISFQIDVYTNLAWLKVDPQPDSVLRVFMAVKPSSARVEMEPQNFEGFERHGFTVVEWGGTLVK